MTFEIREPTMGSLAPLAQELSPGIEKTVLQLVVDGFKRWQSRGFERFGNHENHFTVRLVACMDEVRRERNLGLVPQYQFVEPTDEMLAGREDPDRAPCIDIVISWGLLTENAYLSIECKRIAPDELSRLYVVSGINRFVSGFYGSKASVGAMVGYLIRGTPGDVLKRVNAYVKANPAMGPEQELTQTSAISWLNSVFESDHERPTPYHPIRITHLFFDMKGIGPPP